MAFDLVLRGGLLVDGSGAPGRPSDVGIEGDRITAVGDLSAVDPASVGEMRDATGLVVAPGFVDPHAHSDLSVLVDGAQWSHLRQGYTTQLDGNCGYTFAPLTHLSRLQLQADLEAHGIEPGWSTFAGYLATVEEQALGINSAHLPTWEVPAVYPAGIRDVIVNGRLAVRDGQETGVRAGRLLRRGE